MAKENSQAMPLGMLISDKPAIELNQVTDHFEVTHLVENANGENGNSNDDTSMETGYSYSI